MFANVVKDGDYVTVIQKFDDAEERGRPLTVSLSFKGKREVEALIAELQKCSKNMVDDTPENVERYLKLRKDKFFQ